jgi:alpha-1,6-mannosyltransferase
MSDATLTPSPTEDLARPLLLDTATRWSDTPGSTRGYVLAKRRWIQRSGGWRHAIAAPGVRKDDGLDIGGMALPGLGGHRVPWRRRAAARLMRELQPDVIEAADPYGLAWSTLDAAQSLGVPAVAFCHAELAPLYPGSAGSGGKLTTVARRALEPYLRRTLREFDLVLAPTASFVEALRGIGVSRAELQPLGFDASVFHPRAADSGLRKRLALPERARLLLCAAQSATEKHLDLLVDVIERLGAPYALLVVGATSLWPRRAHPCVRMLPWETNDEALARLLSSIDAFVQAGGGPGTGRMALQAMGCGKPVFVGARDEGRERVAGGAGMRVEADDPACWAEAIAAMFADGPERSGRLALARSLDYRWENVFPALMRRYEDLTDAKVASDAGATVPSVAWRGSI